MVMLNSFQVLRTKPLLETSKSFQKRICWTSCYIERDSLRKKGNRSLISIIGLVLKLFVGWIPREKCPRRYELLVETHHQVKVKFLYSIARISMVKLLVYNAVVEVELC